MTVHAEAPSNIALIKYMGKQTSQKNLPTNPSLSLTLNHLRTRVELTESSHDMWSPLRHESFLPLELSEKGQGRYLEFFAQLKREFKIKGSYEISSANNFPSDCGIASSASSFAALTKAAFKLAQDQDSNVKVKPAEELSAISRKGSGSSCRSFFGPWALWQKEGAEKVDLPLEHVIHQVVLLENSKKEVSSSEAHLRVLSSPEFLGRVQRAEKRLEWLLSSIQRGDWESARQLIWNEFVDMHELFHTSEPKFSYMTGTSKKVLNELQSDWMERKDGPWVTMDAGPNIHLIYRIDQSKVADQIKEQLSSYGPVLDSRHMESQGV